MPTHNIVPYKLSLREFGETDNYWDLWDLSNQDPDFDEDSVVEVLNSFLNDYSANPEEVEDAEKTFRVENFASRDNIVEGIIRTGDYGYSAVLRDIDTNDISMKGMREAEELPFYFIFVLPRTTQGNRYEEGRDGIFVFQTINRRGIKSVFTRLFEEDKIRPKGNTVLEINPVFHQDALERILQADRILEAEFIYKNVPEYDDESLYHLVEGMDTQETDSASMVLKPNRGRSLEFIRRAVRNLIESNPGSFAELVGDETEDVKVKIEKENGTRRKFSVMETDIKMREELEFSSSDLVEGMPTSSAIARESRSLINTVLPEDIAERLDNNTLLE